MQLLRERHQLVTIWNAISADPPTTTRALADRMAAALQAAGTALAASEIDPLLHSLQRDGLPSAEQGQLLLTVLAGDQRLRCEAAYGVLSAACPQGISVAVLQQLLTVFGLKPSEAEAIAIAIDRDGGGEISRDDFLAFVPADFQRHPGTYHASHLGHKPAVTPPRASFQASGAARATAPSSPANGQGATGTSPLQLQIGLFRLVQGAAYRSFRASYSANSETHLRAYDLPYTIEDFAAFVNAAVDLYAALGVVEPEARQPLEDLRRSVNGALEALHHRMQHWHELEPNEAMREAESQLEDELAELDHQHQLFAGLVELLLVAGLQGHDPHQLSSDDLRHHELNRLRHRDDHRELSDHRHGDASSVGRQQRPFLDTWQRVIVDARDTRYAGAIMPTRYWYEEFMPLLLRACSVSTAADLADLDAETEADLDAWYHQVRDAGEFDRYAPAVRAHFPHCPPAVKQEIKQAWRLTRHYLNGVQKRREREEFGRGDGYLSEYVAFIDVYLGRSDIADSEMRLSFPYYLGPATWRFLHTSAELIAARPDAEQAALVTLFKRFFAALATMYPCPYCRYHLNRYVVRNKEMNLYPIEYLLLGPRDAKQHHIEVTLEQKLSVIHDGASLRLFLWKLHNAVSASIARSEPWFHRDEQAHYTTRYWPSLDSELARAEALAYEAIETERVSRIYGVLKQAAHLGVLRDELQLALSRPGSEELRQLWQRAEATVARAEEAVLRSGFLQQNYRYNPQLELADPHFSPEEEALARSGYFMEA